MKNGNDRIVLKDIIIYHPDDEGLPEKHRRIVFVFKSKLVDIDSRYFDHFENLKLQFKLK